MELYWYNYKTEVYDLRDTAPQTDKEAEQYLPQLGGVPLYRIYREEYGLSIEEAMYKVLTKAVGDDSE